MKRIAFLALAVALMLPTMLMAQKRRRAAKTTVVQNPIEAKMLAATAQVVIVDSVVTDSASMLNYIHANPEEARISTYEQFLKSQNGRTDRFKKEGKGYVCMNELGNKCVFSLMNDKGRMRLYQSDLLGDMWSTPEELNGLDNDGKLTDLNFPFLMPDGITLYFAAKGETSLGGYDIYRTRMDTDEGKFLRAENLGMPFCSQANDMMYVADEQNQLAFFATSRRQPQGKVCIYTFVTTETRQTLNFEALGEEKVRAMARIDRIADTWGDGKVRKQALARLQQIGRSNAVSDNQQAFAFILNDQKTITRLADFRNPDNRDRMKDILAIREQLASLKTALRKSRDFYATASSRERRQIAGEILDAEKQEEQLELEQRTLEKEIRNTEKQ